MRRNVAIGVASGVATAIALGLLFGTEKGKKTYRDALDKYKNSDLMSKMKGSKDESDIDYPNKTSKTVAE